MLSNGTIATVREIMVDVLDADEVDINENTTADDVETWDSLSHIRLIVAIERKFHVKFKNSEIESMMNVGDLIKTLDTKLI